MMARAPARCIAVAFCAAPAHTRPPPHCHSYKTAMIGKWNLGNLIKPYTPTRRGFDSYFGYYAAALQDYWYHGSPTCPGTPDDPVVDLSNSTGPNVTGADVFALNGTYAQDMFTNEAERLIRKHAAEDGDQPFYLYLAHKNVHSTSQDLLDGKNDKLQAPAETVALYNKTKLDTYKVMGAMLTELDKGVGRVVSVLKETGLYDNSVVTFACDNGGPLEHSSNSPLRGGKHTMWEGGLRASAWVHSPLLPASARGVKWSGLAHTSDWLPTFVQGLAGLNASQVATGPRNLDGHDMWDAWMHADTSESPRDEVIAQVVNKYCNASQSGRASIAPFGPVIIKHGYKLMGGKPGDDRTIAWPKPENQVVPFGQSGGWQEDNTDHMRAGDLPGNKSTYNCDPWCLFDLEQDPSESKDLASDPAYADIVAKLSHRVTEQGSRGPDWSWPFLGKIEGEMQDEICAVANKTHVYEPLRESPPPNATLELF